MSAPFGGIARREGVAPQLARIETARRRRDTSGVVAMDAALIELLSDRPVPALGGLTPSRFAADLRLWRPTTARWSNGEWMGGEREPDLLCVGRGLRSIDSAQPTTIPVPPSPIVIGEDDFDAEICAGTAQAAEERQKALDWHDIPDAVDPLSRTAQVLVGLAAAAILAALVWLFAFVLGLA